MYPHRITPFNIGICDVCVDNKSTQFISVKAFPHKGLQYCSNSTCKNTINEWMKISTIPIETMIKKFGTTISIRRSGGKRESGWVIVSDGYKEIQEGDFWVKIVNSTGKQSKIVTITMLEVWNPIYKNKPFELL